MILENKVVIITGGSQGFGKALAQAFKIEKAKVIIVSKTQTTLEQTAQELGVDYFVADVRDEDELKNVVIFVVEKFGQIDIWINSAGVFRVFSTDENIDMNKAHEMFDVNFFGSVLGSRTALNYMKEKGGNYYKYII